MARECWRLERDRATAIDVGSQSILLSYPSNSPLKQLNRVYAIARHFPLAFAKHSAVLKQDFYKTRDADTLTWTNYDSSAPGNATMGT